MLVNLKDILKIAEEKNMAVGGFNALDLSTIKADIAAAEEMQTPIVIQFAMLHEKYNRLEDVGPLMVKYAEEASVPVCAMLDHGETVDHIRRALDLGFTGVMFDGSDLPYEENVELTAKCVELAKKCNAGVEAELGSMGKRIYGKEDSTGDTDASKIYTDPKQAAEFVKATGIDALACSFGTTHGIYLTEPRLSFDVVANVRKETGGIPVVMHGGSGVSAEDFRKAINAGVRKINYYTYMDKAAAYEVKHQCETLAPEHLQYFNLLLSAEKAMKENLKGTIEVFSNT